MTWTYYFFLLIVLFNINVLGIGDMNEMFFFFCFNHNNDMCVTFYLVVRGCRPGKIVQMTEAEVRGLCIKSREIFLSQPILLELEAPLKICGENPPISPEGIYIHCFYLFTTFTMLMGWIEQKSTWICLICFKSLHSKTVHPTMLLFLLQVKHI